MNKFIKSYTDYEIFKYQFENGFGLEKSYITEDYVYDCFSDERYKYYFHCCEC